MSAKSSAKSSKNKLTPYGQTLFPIQSQLLMDLLPPIPQPSASSNDSNPTDAQKLTRPKYASILQVVELVMKHATDNLLLIPHDNTIQIDPFLKTLLKYTHPTIKIEQLVHSIFTSLLVPNVVTHIHTPPTTRNTRSKTSHHSKSKTL